MSSVLVTGSHGFIGRHLVPHLKAHGHEVREAGSSSDRDLCDLKQVQSLPATEVIIHLAARSFVPNAFKQPEAFYRNNVLSTLNVLELARQHKSRVIFLSTYVYGNPVELPIPETHPTAPLNPYTQTKLLGEDLCRAYFRDFGVPATIFRPFNVYGPGQSEAFLIPKIISQLDAEEIRLFDPHPKRDYIYIADLVEAIRLAVTIKEEGCGTYNLGSGRSTSVQELAELIRSIGGSRSPIVYSNQTRQGEVSDTVADITAARNALGWAPLTSLAEGLRQILGSRARLIS
jgi:nucleoside-diphosphate-sugar epimerase